MSVKTLKLSRYSQHLDFLLVGIHTDLEDYKLAYILNENLGSEFVKSKQYLDVKFNRKMISFAVFEYENTADFTSWHLIANKSHTISQSKNKNDLFKNSLEPICTTNYLIAEHKKIDYLLRIEGVKHNKKINKTVKKIKNLNQIVASYFVNTNHLKNSDFLIF